MNPLHRFNDLQYYSRGHVISGPAAILSRLVISDYGTNRGNLGVELFSFRTAAHNFAQFLSQVRVADTGSARSSKAGEGPSRALLGPGQGAWRGIGAERHLEAVPEGEADVSRLIELWRKTGILKDAEFPPEALEASGTGVHEGGR